MQLPLSSIHALVHLDTACDQWEKEVLSPLGLLAFERAALPAEHLYWRKRRESIALYAPRLAEAVNETLLPSDEKKDLIFSIYADLFNAYGGRSQRYVDLDSPFYSMHREFIAALVADHL